MKKLCLMLALSLLFVLTFAFTVSAEVTVDSKVTLIDETEVNLFDSEGNALIWWLDANGTPCSINANDSRVNYTIEGTTLKGVEIVLENEAVSKNNVIVFNLLDVSAVAEATTVSGLFGSSAKVQYVYLHENTKVIQGMCFKGTANLKYINLEDLINLKEVNGGDHTSLKIIQDEKDYQLHAFMNKEGQYYYSFSTTDLQTKIQEIAREAGAFDNVN